MEDKIKLLYTLQNLDLKLLELEELKGDLPRLVNNFKEEINALKVQIDQLETEINNHKVAQHNTQLEAESLSDRLDILKKQLYEVKTNKEYDAITKEMTDAEKGILRLLGESEQHEEEAKKLQSSLDELTQNHTSISNELEENQKELLEVSKANEKEEQALLQEREMLANRLPEDTLAHYDRIRFAKDGKAVVPVRRGACGGCYKTISPQLNLQLRKNEEINTCENCGRILISEEIAAEVKHVA